MSRPLDLRRYACEQISDRLGALAYQVGSAAKKPNAEAVHDLRVAVRRFGQSLEIFCSVLPQRPLKKVRKRLRRVMREAAEIRDRDVALELLVQAGVPKDDPLARRLAADRRQAEGMLVQRVKRWQRNNFSAKWRSALQLTSS